MASSAAMYARMKRERAVYWAPGPIDRWGKQSVLDPVEIDCRWEDRHDQFIDIKGQTQISKAVVFTEYELQLSGMLFFGDLGSAPVDPLADRSCWEIRQIERIPNIKAKANWWSALL